MTTWTLGSEAEGLVLKVTAVDDGSGNVVFTITVEYGTANVNAVYWGDGEADGSGAVLAGDDITGKISPSLNMNGTDIDWDAYYALSNPGLKGTEAAAEYTFTLEGVSLADLDINDIGIRATSTSTAEGSIKWHTDTPDSSNTPPVANSDTNGLDAVTEAGVSPGNTAFSGDASASGNVLTNDTDADAGDTKEVVGVLAGTSITDVSGNVGGSVEGTYGSITIADDGTWTYTLNNSDAQTDALAHDAPATDVFTYTMQDGSGAKSTTTITISITGTNDQPIASADVNGSDLVVEAGFSVAGDANATGNVLTNDNDADTGDTKTVIGVQAGTSLSDVSGFVGISVTGTYGSLQIDSDGAWTYVLDNTDTDTNVLAQGVTAQDVFTYTMQDANGATSTTTLTIDITGSNDAPTDIKLTAVNFAANEVPEIDEEDPNAALVGTLTATDPDGSAPYTFTTTSENFEIIDNSLYVTEDIAGPAVTEHEVIVQVADAGGASYTETFNIIIGTNSANNPLPTGADGGDPDPAIIGGEDILFGRNGADMIFAGSGDDTVFGGGGDDVIIGGAGADTLTSSATNDSDTFVYNSLTDAGDVILDFDKGPSNGQDMLDLSDVFDAIGGGVESMTLAELVSGGYLVVDSSSDVIGGVANDTKVSIDADGSVGVGAQPILMITLQDVTLSVTGTDANSWIV